MKSKKKINKQTEQVIYCPYCGAKARLIKARELYGEKAHQWIKKVIEIGTFSENDIYEYLNVKIPYTKEKFHVGTCNEFQCQTAIAALQKIIAGHETSSVDGNMDTENCAPII